MKVRILSGNNVGQLAEMDGSELEFNLSTGFVEPVGEADAPAPEPTVESPSSPADVDSDQQAAADTKAAADAAAADTGE